MMRTLAFASIILLASIGFANAEDTVEQLLSTYDSATDQQKQALEIMLEANAAGISWANAYLQAVRKEKPLFCLPSVAKDGGDIVAMLRRDMRANDRVRTMDYGIVMMAGLMRDNPCPAADK